MGYHTSFDGSFQLDPVLNAAQVEYLQAFAGVRHGQRYEKPLSEIQDPLRTALGLPVGQQGLYVVADESENRLLYSDYNQPAKDAPDLYCPWTCSQDGTQLRSSHPNKAYEPEAWLAFIVHHFIRRWQINATGIVVWQGERLGDSGAYILDNNQLEVITFGRLLRAHLNHRVDLGKLPI